MYTVVVGGGHGYIEECRKAAKNVAVKIVGEGVLAEQVEELIRKHSPHAALIPGEWAGVVADMAMLYRNVKFFVSGGVAKSFVSQWEETGLNIYSVSSKMYKAFLDIEANLKFTSPVNLRFDEVITELPSGFFYFENFSSVQDIAEREPIAILVEAGEGTIEKVKTIGREYKLSAVPIIVVGNCDAAACYAAGAYDCIKELTVATIENIRHKATKMRGMWEESARDDLTGLYKRGFLNEYLKDKERRYRETGGSFTILLFDLDHFKKINDNFGHPVGDIVLKKFAVFLRDNVRKTDIVARYGGEEFMAVFSGMDDIPCIAEKLCRSWAAQEISLPGREKIRSSFSAGLAVMGRDAHDLEKLIKAADDALYKAKREGRNRIKSADNIIPGSLNEKKALSVHEKRGTKTLLLPFSGIARRVTGNVPAFVVGIGISRPPDTSMFSLSLYRIHKEVNSINALLTDFEGGGMPPDLSAAIKKGSHIYLLFIEDIDANEVARLSSQTGRVAKWYLSKTKCMLVTAEGEPKLML